MVLANSPPTVSRLVFDSFQPVNSYTGRLNYAGRSGSASDSMEAEEQTPGGVGIQVQGEWTHHFSPKWSLTANAAFATKYFPDITADVALRHYLKNDWEIGAHVGYRRVAVLLAFSSVFSGGNGGNDVFFSVACTQVGQSNLILEHHASKAR